MSLWKVCSHKYLLNTTNIPMVTTPRSPSMMHPYLTNSDSDLLLLEYLRFMDKKSVTPTVILDNPDLKFNQKATLMTLVLNVGGTFSFLPCWVGPKPSPPMYTTPHPTEVQTGKARVISEPIAHLSCIPMLLAHTLKLFLNNILCLVVGLKKKSSSGFKLNME